MHDLPIPVGSCGLTTCHNSPESTITCCGGLGVNCGTLWRDYNARLCCEGTSIYSTRVYIASSRPGSAALPAGAGLKSSVITTEICKPNWCTFGVANLVHMCLSCEGKTNRVCYSNGRTRMRIVYVRVNLSMSSGLLLTRMTLNASNAHHRNGVLGRKCILMNNTRTILQKEVVLLACSNCNV